MKKRMLGILLVLALVLSLIPLGSVFASDKDSLTYDGTLYCVYEGDGENPLDTDVHVYKDEELSDEFTEGKGDVWTTVAIQVDYTCRYTYHCGIKVIKNKTFNVGKLVFLEPTILGEEPEDIDIGSAIKVMGSASLNVMDGITSETGLGFYGGNNPSKNVTVKNGNIEACVDLIIDGQAVTVENGDVCVNEKYYRDPVLELYNGEKNTTTLSVPKGDVSANDINVSEVHDPLDPGDKGAVLTAQSITLKGDEYTWLNIRSGGSVKLKEETYAVHAITGEGFGKSYISVFDGGSLIAYAKTAAVIGATIDYYGEDQNDAKVEDKTADGYFMRTEDGLKPGIVDDYDYYVVLDSFVPATSILVRPNYTVTYMNEGETFGTVYAAKGDFLTPPNPSPTAEYKTFTGWYDEDGERWIFLTHRVFGDKTLTAGYDWECKAELPVDVAKDDFDPNAKYNLFVNDKLALDGITWIKTGDKYAITKTVGDDTYHLKADEKGGVTWEIVPADETAYANWLYDEIGFHYDKTQTERHWNWKKFRFLETEVTTTYYLDFDGTYFSTSITPNQSEITKSVVSLDGHNECYKDNGDGKTHTVYCDICQKVLNTEAAHEGVDHCTKCNAAFSLINLLDPETKVVVTSEQKRWFVFRYTVYTATVTLKTNNGTYVKNISVAEKNEASAFTKGNVYTSNTNMSDFYIKAKVKDVEHILKYDVSENALELVSISGSYTD